MSPAILTETVWALAQAKPPVIPQRVVALTTMPGKARIEDELFTHSPDYAGRSVWQALRRAVLGPKFETDPRLNLDEVRLIARRDPKLGRAFPLEDIRTPADNDTAADFILEELRKLTENADTRVIASLAGRRKTMGALLYAALSLLGCAQGRLTHVLVSEPFEDPGLRPRFYFPMQPDTLHQHPRTGGVQRGDVARIWLADVPFVRLRKLSPRQLGHYPGTFSGLVQAYGQHIETLSGPPEVGLDAAGSALQVNGIRITLAPRELALYTFLLERCRDAAPAYEQQKDALEDFQHWLAAWGRRFAPLIPVDELPHGDEVTKMAEFHASASMLRSYAEARNLVLLNSTVCVKVVAMMIIRKRTNAGMPNMAGSIHIIRSDSRTSASFCLARDALSFAAASACFPCFSNVRASIHTERLSLHKSRILGSDFTAPAC
jgi:CRISPR-associated protein (TIGR02584 family)